MVLIGETGAVVDDGGDVGGCDWDSEAYVDHTEAPVSPEAYIKTRDIWMLRVWVVAEDGGAREMEVTNRFLLQQLSSGYWRKAVTPDTQEIIVVQAAVSR